MVSNITFYIFFIQIIVIKSDKSHVNTMIIHII